MTIEVITRFAKILIFFALVILLIVIYNNHGCRKVEGPEMEPSIPRDKHAWLAPRVRDPEQLDYGDVVVFKYYGLGLRQTSVAARVVGKPGDRVKIVKGEVFRNEQPLREEFIPIPQRSTETLEEIVVPRAHVYLLCDSRRSAAGLDSREIGPVSQWAVGGKVR